MRTLSAVVAAGAGLLACCCCRAGTAPVSDLLEFRVPAPAPVGLRELETGFEIGAPLGWGQVFRAADGRLFMIGNGRILHSNDQGRTWTDGRSLELPVTHAVRLQSGALAGLAANSFHVSEDDGRTWTEVGTDILGGGRGSAYPNTLIQARNGHLLLPVRYTNAAHQQHYDASGAWGTLNGALVRVEGHAHFPEADIAYLLLSANGGKTWSRSNGTIMIWHDQGYGGMWPCDEPSVVDGHDDSVFMFMRTTLGRLYMARSSSVDYYNQQGARLRYEPGRNFDYPKPLPLAGSYSPCAVRVIPTTGDWLLVWNQVTAAEIRAGYRRARLCSAVSRDDGRTWQHFRTLDAVVLPPAGRLTPEADPAMARGLDYVGILPTDFGSVSYPSISIVDETVFLFFYRIVVQPRPGDVTGRRLRVLPLSWFYGEEPPLPPGPRLVLRVPAGDGLHWNRHQVPSRFHKGRFLVDSRDVATFLKSPAGRLRANFSAPLHQVITCLGWIPEYDRSHLEDADDPCLIVSCRHVHSVPPVERILIENEANSDVRKHRVMSQFLGRMTEDVSAAQYNRERRGLYDVAQSVSIPEGARLTAVAVYLVGTENCARGARLALVPDADGMPGNVPLTPAATVVSRPLRGSGEFRRFDFKEPVPVQAGDVVWIVLTKEDEDSVNPMYGVPFSGKGEEGEARDWYEPGAVASRGPYAKADEPGAWGRHEGRDIYFRLLAECERSSD